MKKLFFTLCALCLCGTMWAQTYQDQTTGLYYTLDEDNNATIVAPTDENVKYSNENLVSYSSIDGAYTIPEKVGDYSVIAVGEQAFNEATISGTLVIPSYVNTIGAAAFYNCTSLTKVIFEESDTSLEDLSNTSYYAMFSGATYITSVELYRDITYDYGSGVCGPFAYHDRLATVIIGEKVTQIPSYMFRGHYATTNTLTTVTCYAENPPTLGTGVFSYNANTELTLYTPYDYLNNYRLDSDWNVIFDADHMHALGNEGDPDWPTDELAFQYNGLWFEPIYEEDGETETGNCVLIADQGGEVYEGEITIPETATNSVSGVTYTVTRIDTNAFANSQISGHIVIPSSILYMGVDAFLNCTGITEVTYEYSPTQLWEECLTNNAGGYSFDGCTSILTVNQYRNINWENTGSQSGPFVGQTSITTINIGPRVTLIQSYLYRQRTTSTVTTINCYAAAPPTLGSAPFDNLPTGYVINVPQGSLSDYQTSWSGYSNFAELSNAYAVNIHNVDADGDGYATFYDSKAVKLYGDVVAYTVSGVEVDEETNNAYVLMQELGDVIPAGTGALLAGDVAYYTAIEETAVSSETYSGTDYLLGFDEDGQTTVAPNNGDANDYYFYMLTLDSANDENSLAFYWGAESGGTFTCSAHKAYLALEKEVVGTNNVKLKKGDNDGDETTGISSVESATEGASVKGIYTIQGVRVSNMNQPGLYIVDGKKVLVK